ncbi:hypothetical protein QBC42DRAFT_249954 [Cladorrhinum samala]|uniref:Uncharacterized protein n=1 Tax=Cladorrhinum samala TaxID=585594 RepID=A0AAV9HVD1_9PEZI|nr:hypothetical protein QBC42DRAFT_249954 [Cladorrhinum samala]
MAAQEKMLHKFKAAQLSGSSGLTPPSKFRTFTVAVREMREGARQGNWAAHMLPALRVHDYNGEYHIESFDQAVAYLKDEQLGRNLGYILAVILLQTPQGVDVETLMGSAEGVKQLHACVTLWDYITKGCGQEPHTAARSVCGKILKKYFKGENDGEPDTVSAYSAWSSRQVVKEGGRDAPMSIRELFEGNN